ncbi:AEC family transporter [Nocardioides sp. CFH 31398]|uniref:AEC family transporter n=1 Tax=Nocardioides sp. CFH 31398 TaxID=2919579 RepID=UPI001F06F872|nr:AEC family transporter [Nocardioides sp. CFH 31398]MCH1868788.1 AEC family transporter [Nocardioides sp. CFH 31398]
MDLLTGFAAVVGVVLVGVLLGHLRLVDDAGRRTLNDVSFFAASPALMLLVISDVEMDADLAANVATAVVSLGVAMVAYLLVARLVLRRDGGEALIGALTAGYVNAGNLGIPVAAFVVGDVAVVVPTLLVQMLFVQPLALAYLDRRRGRGSGFWAAVRRIVTNPLTVGAAIGLLLALTGWRLPALVEEPLSLLAGLAVPAMLLAYGVAMRLAPPVGGSGHNAEVAVASALKLLVMPLVAWLVGLALGLDGTLLLGVVIVAALPTAQNIFVHASRYRIGEDMAREAIFVTTVAALPVSLGVALLLG